MKDKIISLWSDLIIYGHVVVPNECRELFCKTVRANGGAIVEGGQVFYINGDIARTWKKMLNS